MTEADPPQTFPRSHRLSGRLAFANVFEAKCRHGLGPLLVYAKKNDLPHSRLGLTVSRKVGNAGMRNRIKRLLREAYRLDQHELPSGLDLVVVVKPHRPMALAAYRDMLGKAAKKLQAKCGDGWTSDETGA